jgi:hypothetical protein
MRYVVNFMLDDVVDKLNHNAKNCILKELKSDLKTLMRTFEAITSTKVTSQDQVLKLYDVLKFVIVQLEDYKLKIREILKPGEEYDENDQEDLERNIEELNELCGYVMELSGYVFKIYKQDLSQVVFNFLGEHFEKYWNVAISTKNLTEVINSMCFFQDFMQFSTVDYFKKVYPFYLKNCLNFNTNDQNVIQNTVFGFGIIAERIDQSLYQNIHDTLFNVTLKFKIRP